MKAFNRKNKPKHSISKVFYNQDVKDKENIYMVVALNSKSTSSIFYSLDFENRSFTPTQVKSKRYYHDNILVCSINGD